MKFKFISFTRKENGRFFIESRHYNYQTALNYAKTTNYKIGKIIRNCKAVGWAKSVDQWEVVEKQKEETRPLAKLKKDFKIIDRKIRDTEFNLKYMKRKKEMLKGEIIKRKKLNLKTEDT
jgi:hypothetical protein